MPRGTFILESRELLLGDSHSYVFALGGGHPQALLGQLELQRKAGELLVGTARRQSLELPEGLERVEISQRRGPERKEPQICISSLTKSSEAP